MKRDLELTPAQLAQEVTVKLPLGVLLGIGVENVPAQPVRMARPSDLPAIGAKYLDGVYAGITVHDNQPMALVLLPGDEKKAWTDAKAWAEMNGGELPSRIDQLVLFKNLKSEFKDAWYWSGEQFAGYAASAWGQGFGYGRQDDTRKDDACRCRAVRRVPIQ